MFNFLKCHITKILIIQLRMAIIVLLGYKIDNKNISKKLRKYPNPIELYIGNLERNIVLFCIEFSVLCRPIYLLIPIAI